MFERPPSSRPSGIVFDPQRRAATGELKAVAKGIAELLQRREAEMGLRKRRRTEDAQEALALAVEAIVCNLAGLALMLIQRPLAVPRSSDVMWSKDRYHSPVYGQHFLDALDLMAHPEISLIEEVARGYGSKSGKGWLTLVSPAGAFFTHVPMALIAWQSFTREEEPEVLILKGRKDPRSGQAKALAYRETAQTRRMRNEVRSINAYLREARFWLVADGERAGETKEGLSIDPTRRTVKRIFNNGSWHQGGRLFGGFWETMRSADRRFLRIATAAHPEGEEIANVDYGQLFPRLAYMRAQAAPPAGDLYAFGDRSWHRQGIKRVLNALLLAESPLRNWPDDTRELFPAGTKLSDVVAAIRHHHHPIASALGTGQGLIFMWIESQLLIDTLARLRQRGITALPLHDSVLVGASDEAAAVTAMHEACEQFGPTLSVRVETKKII